MKKKRMRDKGKISFSKYFQEFNEGDCVSVIKDQSVVSTFPARLQGRTGFIESKRGKSYVVKINDQNKEKRYIIEPIHLKKIKTILKNDKQK